MSFNEEAADLFAYQHARLEDVGSTNDMEALPALLGYTLVEGRESRLVGREIHVKTKQPLPGRHSDIAHEASHALAQERDDPDALHFEEIIRHRHAHTPNVEAQVEALIKTGQDRIRMPTDVVKAVINICGLKAMAVWVLHQQEKVYLHEALRRIVELDENARMGGFIAWNGTITHAYSYRYHMPCWINDPIPDVDDYENSGLTIFTVPGSPSTVIGLVVIDESGPI
ncbi:hypothetical protein [Deinococcus irradiatisoli]|uniref:hypothetical protein n=1 Tax=Deinococcus irradiatisoli TaxID=2202254 RepID=UPI0011B1CAFD|nr:hypothetical protein [Deinococcus irradiatisoli]